MRRRRLTRIIALHLTITIAVIAIAAGVAARIFINASPRIAIGFAIALFLLGIATMSITMRRPFRRIRRNLGALVDGVRGFSDGDFSLRLHVTGGDEITDLVAVYNEIGDVLREQRNDSVQRELL